MIRGINLGTHKVRKFTFYYAVSSEKSIFVEIIT